MPLDLKNKEKLYIVGGYIRNQILGISDMYNIDIDIMKRCCEYFEGQHDFSSFFYAIMIRS